MDPLQQQAYAQMLNQMTPTPTQGAYTPQMSPAQALNNGIQPLIQALAARRMQQMLDAPQLPPQTPAPVGGTTNGSYMIFGGSNGPTQGPSPNQPLNYDQSIFQFAPGGN
jgi:hypothetical protein